VNNLDGFNFVWMCIKGVHDVVQGCFVPSDTEMVGMLSRFIHRAA
jgi:hypothetical protein